MAKGYYEYQWKKYRAEAIYRTEKQDTFIKSYSSYEPYGNHLDYENLQTYYKYGTSYTISNGKYTITNFVNDFRNANYFVIPPGDKILKDFKYKASGYSTGSYEKVVYKIYGDLYGLQDTQVLSHYAQGDFIGEVKSTTETAYPKNGKHSDGYWYEYVGSQWISTNQDPVISTSATQLGVQSQDFKISYSVSDPDNNPVTVEVYRDGTKTPQSPFVAVSGQSYSEQFALSQFEIGNHTMVVKATDSEGGTVTKTWNWTRANANPTISGSDEDLGNQNSGFSVVFTVDDIDASDELTATIMLNEKLLKTVNNVKRKTEQTVTISDGEVFALEIGKLNTITIKVDDGKGGVSYRYKYFKRSNTAPKLSGEPEINLGSLTAPKEISFTATDAEKDKMTYSIYLNDKEILSNQELTDGEAKKFTLSKLQFSKLDNVNTHILKVVVTDAQKATAVQTFKFKRSLTSCWYQVKKETDARAGSMYVYTNITLADGAKLKVLVCNNAFDASPTWEDMTQVHNQRGTYQIKNMTKTAAKWGIGLKVEILPGTSKEPSWINGIGGAFK